MNPITTKDGTEAYYKDAKCQRKPIGCKQIQSMQATVNNNSSASRRHTEHALKQ
jgi:hypothetical protein